MMLEQRKSDRSEKDQKLWDYVTVLAPVGSTAVWFGVMLFHVACWAAAIATGVMTYLKTKDFTDATKMVKFLSQFAPIVYGFVVLVVLIHSLSFGVPAKRTGASSPVNDAVAVAADAILFGITACALVMSFTVVIILAPLGIDYAIAPVLAVLFVCLGGAMVRTFYVNFTMYGGNTYDRAPTPPA